MRKRAGLRWAGLRWADHYLTNNYLTSISPVSRQYFTSISPVSHLYLTSISPVSHQYLTSISPVSHQYLTIISPVSHQYLTSISTIHGLVPPGSTAGRCSTVSPQYLTCCFCLFSQRPSPRTSSSARRRTSMTGTCDLWGSTSGWTARVMAWCRACPPHKSGLRILHASLTFGRRFRGGSHQYLTMQYLTSISPVSHKYITSIQYLTSTSQVSHQYPTSISPVS